MTLVVAQWMAMRAPTRGAPTIGVSQCTPMHVNANSASFARNDGHCPVLFRIAPQRPGMAISAIVAWQWMVMQDNPGDHQGHYQIEHEQPKSWYNG